jgi:uncharacterized protein YqeY
MTLLDTLTADLTQAMKAQDEARRSCLRLAKAALKNKEIEKRAPLDDGEITQILQGLVKQREDSVEQFQRGNRPDLVAKEEAEIRILKAYLPSEVSEEEVRAAVEAAIVETGAQSQKDIGRVMGKALAALKASGKTVDGKKVNEAARARLGP